MGFDYMYMFARSSTARRPTASARSSECIYAFPVTHASHRQLPLDAVQADVVLRGYSGYNLAWAQHLLAKVFPLQAPPLKPALVTIFFGANDAALAGGVK